MIHTRFCLGVSSFSCVSRMHRKLCFCDVTSTPKALNTEVLTCVWTHTPVVCCQRGCSGLISSDKDSIQSLCWMLCALSIQGKCLMDGFVYSLCHNIVSVAVITLWVVFSGNHWALGFSKHCESQKKARWDLGRSSAAERPQLLQKTQVWSPVPARCLTTVCNSNTKRSDAFFRSLSTPSTHVTYIHAGQHSLTENKNEGWMYSCSLFSNILTEIWLGVSDQQAASPARCWPLLGLMICT